MASHLTLDQLSLVHSRSRPLPPRVLSTSFSPTGDSPIPTVEVASPFFAPQPSTSKNFILDGLFRSLEIRPPLLGPRSSAPFGPTLRKMLARKASSASGPEDDELAEAGLSPIPVDPPTRGPSAPVRLYPSSHRVSMTKFVSRPSPEGKLGSADILFCERLATSFPR